MLTKKAIYSKSADDKKVEKKQNITTSTIIIRTNLQISTKHLALVEASYDT